MFHDHKNMFVINLLKVNKILFFISLLYIVWIYSVNPTHIYEFLNMVVLFSFHRLNNINTKIYCNPNYRCYNNKQFSTSSVLNKFNDLNEIKNESNLPLDPNFVTGFTDAEGSFIVSFYRRSNQKWNLRIRFLISLHSMDYPLLLELQKFFNNKGSINFSSNRPQVNYEITSINDLVDYVIPHFDKYPLLTKKFIDYNLWKIACEIVKTNGHLNPDGFKKVISLAMAMNNKTKSMQIEMDYPDVLIFNSEFIPRSSYEINPYWLVGFTAGDGSFSSSPIRNSFRVRFSIGQHNRDLELLYKIKDYFGIGAVYTKKTDPICSYAIDSYKNNYKYILPFFDEYPLPEICHKSKNYLIWREILLIMINGGHFSEKNSKLIKYYQSQLNNYNA